MGLERYDWRDKDRHALAVIAAHGLFSPGSYGTPESFSYKVLLEKTGIGFGELPHILDRLVDWGLVRKSNTGYNGYGDQWVPGVDVYAVTQKGLIALWA